MTCHAMIIIIILNYFTSCFTLAHYICAKINETIEPEITSIMLALGLCGQCRQSTMEGATKEDSSPR